MINFRPKQTEPKRGFRKHWLPKFDLLNSIGAKLFIYVLCGALMGLGGMSYFFYQVLEQQAKDEIRGTLRIQVKSIDAQQKRVEESIISLASAVKTMQQIGIKDIEAYKTLTFNFFQQRPPLLMGIGFGQTPFQIIPDRRGYWPYFYVEQAESEAVGQKLSASDILYSDLYPDDNYFEQIYYTEPVAKKKNLWTEPFDWHGITMMSSLVPIFDNNKKMIGIVGADVNVTTALLHKKTN